MKYETILYKIDDKVARITINQAEEMNRLSNTVLKEIVHAAQSADHFGRRRKGILRRG